MEVRNVRNGSPQYSQWKSAIFTIEVRNFRNGSLQNSQRKSLLKVASRVVSHQGRVSVHRPGRALRAGRGRMVGSACAYAQIASARACTNIGHAQCATRAAQS